MLEFYVLSNDKLNLFDEMSYIMLFIPLKWKLIYFLLLRKKISPEGKKEKMEWTEHMDRCEEYIMKMVCTAYQN